MEVYSDRSHANLYDWMYNSGLSDGFKEKVKLWVRGLSEEEATFLTEIVDDVRLEEAFYNSGENQ